MWGLLEFCDLKLILWRKFSPTLDRPKEIKRYKYQLLHSLLLWVLGHGHLTTRVHTHRTESGRVGFRTRAHTTCRHEYSSIQLALDHIFYTSELCNIGIRTRELLLLYNTRSSSWWCVLGVTTSPRVASEEWTRSNNLILGTMRSRSDCLNSGMIRWIADCELGAMLTRNLPRRSKFGTTHRSGSPAD